MKDKIDSDASKSDALTLYLPAIFILLVTSIAIVWLSIFDLDDDGPVAVIFPPGQSAEKTFHLIAQTDATIIRYGLIGGIVIVQPLSPKFFEQSRKLGAIAVTNPITFGGCNPKSIRRTGLQ